MMNLDMQPFDGPILVGRVIYGETETKHFDARADMPAFDQHLCRFEIETLNGRKRHTVLLKRDASQKAEGRWWESGDYAGHVLAFRISKMAPKTGYTEILATSVDHLDNPPSRSPVTDLDQIPGLASQRV